MTNAVRQPVVVKIGGCNGSGKSTLAFALLDFPHKPFYDDLVPKGKVAGYIVQHPKAKIRVLGRYESACGGIDSVGNVDVWAPLAKKYSTDATVDIVFLEGLMSGKVYGQLGAWSERPDQKGRWLYAFMDTPFDICVERVLARRHARGNLAPFDPERTMRSTFRGVQGAERLARAAGHTVMMLDHTTSPAARIDLLIRAARKMQQ
jgi:hypothetical protein